MERNRLLGYLIMMFILPAILDQIVATEQYLYCPLNTTALNLVFTPTQSQDMANYCPLDASTLNANYPISNTQDTANYCPLDTTIFE